MRFVRVALLAGFALALSILALSCGLIGGDDAGTPSGVKILSVQLSNQVGADGELINPSHTFAPGTRQVRASVRLEGVRSGMRVTGKWYQLGVANAPAEGAEASTSETVLDAATISPEGRTRVSFSLTVGGQGFSQESVWLLRVYVNDSLSSTNGFAITQLAAAVQPGTAPPVNTAPPVAPTPRVYTVVAGDTLTTVAQRFLPANGNVNTFVTQIAQLNNIAPTAPLVPGQVLRIP
jgi:LysM repeat protein